MQTRQPTHRVPRRSGRRVLPRILQGAPLVAGLLMALCSHAVAQELTWARLDGGAGRELATHVASRPDGGVVTGGEYWSSMTLGGGEPTETTLPHVSYNPAYLASYDAAGSLEWATQAYESSYYAYLNEVAVAGDGSIAVAGLGQRTSSMTFYGTNGTTQAVSINSNQFFNFVAKWNTDGELQWVRVISASSISTWNWYQDAVGLAGLSDGSFVSTGTFYGVVDFGDGATQLQATADGYSGAWNTYVVRYAPDGSVVYANQVTGGEVFGTGMVAALADDSVAFTGVYLGYPGYDYYYGARIGDVYLNDGYEDQLYMAKVDASGNAEWMVTPARSDDYYYGPYYVNPLGLSAGPDGELTYTGSQYYYGVTFGPGQANATYVVDWNSAYYAAFVARFDGATGQLRWARPAAEAWGTSYYDDYALVLGGASDAAGGSIVCGYYDGEVIFGAGTANEVILSTDSFGGFLARYGSDGSFDWVRETPRSGALDGANGFGQAFDVDVSGDGSLDVAGYHYGTNTYGYGHDNQTTLTATGSGDAFTAKYDGGGGASITPPENIVAQCDDHENATAIVNFLVQVTGTPAEGSTLVVTDVTSGTVLYSEPAAARAVGIGPLVMPLGVSEIEVSLVDAGGEIISLESFEIVVEDTIAPSIAGAADKTIECQGPETTLFPTLLGIRASDDCDSNPEITFAPATVAMGTTSVTVSAQDHTGNTSSETFDVTVVDTVPPIFIEFPLEAIVRECEGEAGAEITFAVDAVDACQDLTITCEDQSGNPVDPNGTTFSHGVHAVTCTATDLSGNSSEVSFEVSVVDTTDPVIVCPTDLTVGNDPGECSAVVEFTVEATDVCDLDVPVTVVADGMGPVSSGDSFPVGTTTVTATAFDIFGNEASCSFNITVLDVEAPVMTAPDNVTLVTDCAGSVLSIGPADLSVSATDNCDTELLISCSPSALSPGTATVSCSVTDSAGNSSTTDVTVTLLKGPFDCALLRPLDGNVDNRIKAGRTVPVKLHVACENVFDPTVTAIVEEITVIADDVDFANEVTEDSGDSNDDGIDMRLAADDEFYIYNLSTKDWDSTSGTRFRVTLRVSQVGHVDTVCEFYLVNR